MTVPWPGSAARRERQPVGSHVSALMFPIPEEI